jgi:hypothetical protein
VCLLKPAPYRHRHIAVGSRLHAVAQFVTVQFVEALLLLAILVGERGAFDVEGQHTGGGVDLERAEMGADAQRIGLVLRL